MRIAVWWVATTLLACASAACAEEPIPAAAGSSAAAGRPAVDAPSLASSATGVAGEQGMRVYLDPVTGELTDGPVTPEQRAMDEAMALPQPDYSKVTFETLEDGTVMAHGNGQFESTSTIRIDAQGQTHVGCTHTGAQAEHGHAALPQTQP